LLRKARATHTGTAKGKEGDSKGTREELMAKGGGGEGKNEHYPHAEKGKAVTPVERGGNLSQKRREQELREGG